MVQLTVTVFDGHQWGGRWTYYAVNYLIGIKGTHLWPGRDWIDVRGERPAYNKATRNRKPMGRGVRVYDQPQ